MKTAAFLPSLIYPPPDIRAIVDKTASYVAKNGVAFEDRIRENEKANIKFGFLHDNDPYHAYYEYKLECIKDNKLMPEPRNVQLHSIQHQKPKEVAPHEPDPFEFVFESPIISQVDLNILKLTSVFVAKNGKRFVSILELKEHDNHQFDFLKESHAFYPLFSNQVEQYSRVLNPSLDKMEYLKKDSSSIEHVLNRIRSRVNYQKYRAREILKDRENSEESLFESIDWHDFVIVETIEFGEEDNGLSLPQPIRVESLQKMPMTEKREETTVEVEADEAEMEIEEETIDTQICPICSKQVPVNQIEEHMRIELIDPKWREQNEARLKKQKESNLYSHNVARNLQNIVEHKNDLLMAEKTVAPSQATREKVIWNGRADSINVTSRLAQKRLHSLQEGSVTNSMHPTSIFPSTVPPPPTNHPMQFPISEDMNMLPPGVPLPPGMRPPDTNSSSKKARTGSDLIPEDVFIAQCPGPININIQLHSEFNRTVTKAFKTIATISDVKDFVCEETKVPKSRIKLSLAGIICQNPKSLGFYNIDDNSTLVMGIKQRGGRK